MRDPLGPPPGARHPDVVFLMALCLLSGVLQLVSPESRSSSISAVLPWWLTAVWASLLIVGASVTLTGIFWRGRTTGLLLEAVGRVMFGPAALVFAGAALTYAGAGGILAAAPFIGFAVSSLWRIRQIRNTIYELRSTMATMSWAADHPQDEP